jgi:hypothetical protein
LEDMPWRSLRMIDPPIVRIMSIIDTKNED